MIEKMLTYLRLLSLEQRQNLRWHAENGTRILCGADAHLYARDGAG